MELFYHFAGFYFPERARGAILCPKDGMPSPNPKKTIFARARSWYSRFERPISSISLVGGFVFDAFALRRVDFFWDNVWVVGHLAIVSICAIWINLLDNTADESGVRPEANPQKLHFWLVNVMQFFFGGILSTYLVFYFRSGTLATSWPFLAILAAAFVANESLKRHYARLAFQVALLFLAFYSFSIYLMPIVLHEISTRVFLVSGVVSLTAIGLVIAVLAAFSRERFKGQSGRLVMLVIAVVFIVMNGLYFLRLIPPLPLSLMDADAYQALTVNGPGRYTVQRENRSTADILPAVRNFFGWNQTVHIMPGDPLFAYTAVFSPTALNVQIIHEWQYYDAVQNAWVTRGRISLPVTGGADGGWRTFSEEFGITAGPWRINVLTPAGFVIGRLRFDVVVQNTEPALTAEEID
jgi:hypothetical protein